MIKKLEANLYYEATKGGVDTTDEMLCCYVSNTPSEVWLLTAIFNVLDAICLYSFVIAQDMGMTHLNRRNFLLHFGEYFFAT